MSMQTGYETQDIHSSNEICPHFQHALCLNEDLYPECNFTLSLAAVEKTQNANDGDKYYFSM